MVSPARIKTNRLLAKAFDLNDFLDPTRLAHDELQYYNDLTRSFDKIISYYINWLDSSEAKKLFYEEIQNREEYFQTIDSDLDDIIQDTSLSADRIIEKVYRKGLSYGYKDINRLPVFNDACKYGLKATQEYNFELISNVSNDLIDSIRHHIFRGIAEGQSIHEVARAITDSGLKPLKGKTLTAYQRASLIARTEIARSMTTGRLQSYANYGVEKVKILTAGDDNVCPICRKAEKKIYTLEESSNLVPFHPACRCSVIAHIEHYKLPEKVIDNPNIMCCTHTNKSYPHNQQFNLTAKEEFEKLSKNKNIEGYENQTVDFYDDALNNSDEKFYKYKFKYKNKPNITIYKSVSGNKVSVEQLYDYFDKIPFDKLKNSCNQIVLSKYNFRDSEGKSIGGYVPKKNNNNIYIFNKDYIISTEDAKEIMFHEIGHCFDKNYKFSKDQNFRNSHDEDYSNLSNPDKHLTDNQKNISKYVNDKIVELKENYNKLSVEERSKHLDKYYGELFAESIKELLNENTFVIQMHKNKYMYINNII